jgi:hypothetical protein
VIRVKVLPLTLIMTLVTHMGSAGDIRRFTDSKGILHISNVETAVQPNPSQFQASSLTGTLPPRLDIIPAAFESPPQTGKAGPALVTPQAAISEDETLSQSNSVEALFRQVYEAAKELNPGVAGTGPPEQPQEASDPTPIAHPPSRGSILSYKDHQGVIRITCRSEGEAESTIQTATGAEPQEKSVLPVTGQPAFRQVTWPVPQMAAAAFPRTSLPAPLSDPNGNTIRGYRDSKGVWRISNNPPPEISPVIPMAPMVQTASASGITKVPFSPDINSSPDLSMGRLANGPLPRTAPQTIMARRDRWGISHIYNLAAAPVRDQSSPVSFLGKLPPDLEPIIVEAALTYQLPISLILALIRNESNFAPQAISPKGAMGLMQLMPGTAAFLGVQHPFSPRENILGGCRYFRLLLDHFQGSVPLALAAYNAGSQRVISAGYQVPPIKETQGFVSQVMALYCLLEKFSASRL